jgi:hypothetical protein
MAAYAGWAESAIVRVVLSVAGDAVLRRALESTTLMTGQTRGADVPAGEREASAGVVKDGSKPTAGCVALGAVLAKLTCMGIVGLVAREAEAGGAGVEIVSVALVAGYILVQTQQGEGRQRVVEASLGPADGRVALRAIIIDGRCVAVLSVVAGGACGGCFQKEAL